mgnify:CR=1 FL=1
MIWTEHSASQGRAVQCSTGLDWAGLGSVGMGSAGLGRNRRSEWGGHIFKGKMNIIKMITAIHLLRCHRASEASRQASSHCNRFGVKYKQIIYIPYIPYPAVTYAAFQHHGRLF